MKDAYTDDSTTRMKDEEGCLRFVQGGIDLPIGQASVVELPPARDPQTPTKKPMPAYGGVKGGCGAPKAASPWQELQAPLVTGLCWHLVAPFRVRHACKGSRMVSRV